MNQEQIIIQNRKLNNKDYIDIISNNSNIVFKNVEFIKETIPCKKQHGYIKNRKRWQ